VLRADQHIRLKESRFRYPDTSKQFNGVLPILFNQFGDAF
jgi:hypothetical protein